MASKVHRSDIFSSSLLSIWMVYFDCEKKIILCFAYDLENKKLKVRGIFYHSLNGICDNHIMYRINNKL